MRKYIENLQQKPDHKKRQIAFLASTGCMVVIAGIWMMTFSVRFPSLYAVSGVNPTDASTEQSLEADQAAAVVAPLDSLRQNFNSGLDDVKQVIDEGPTTMPSVPTQYTSPYNQDSIVSNGVIITDPNSN